MDGNGWRRGREAYKYKNKYKYKYKNKYKYKYKYKNLPRNVLQIYSEIWLPDFDSEK